MTRVAAPMLLLLSACRAEPAPEGLLVGGCAARPSASRCVLRAAPTVWVAAPSSTPTVTLDGAAVAVEGVEVEGGLRWDLPIDGAGALRVRWPEGRALALELERPEVPELSSDACGQPLDGAPWLQALAWSQAARRGDPAGREACRTLAAAAFAEAGWARDAALEQLRAAIEDLGAGAAPSEVEARLPSVRGDGDADLAYAEAYVRAFLDRERGVHRGAQRSFRDAFRMARRALPDHWAAAARSEIADLASRSGEHARALEMLAGRLRSPSGPADELHGRLDFAWALLLALEEEVDLSALSPETRALGLDPEHHLRRAEALAVSTATRDVALLADVRVDLALAAWRRGALDEASAQLALLDGEGMYLRTRHWRDEVLARVALSRGRYEEALARWELELDDGRRTGDLAAIWRGWDGVARVHLARGELAEADEAWSRAASAFLEHAAFVPLHHGREAFLTTRRRAALSHARVRLERGDPAGALRLLRDFRRQYLATVRLPEQVEALPADALPDWETALQRYADLRATREELVQRLRTAPEDERAALGSRLSELEAETSSLLDTGLTTLLPELTDQARVPAAAELLLALVGDRDRWLALGRLGGRHVVEDVPRAAPTALSAALEAPLREARVVTLLPDLAADRADLHAELASLWSSRTLVQWSLDLGRHTPSRGGPVALVVADPARNLPAAREEGQDVARRLEADGVRTVLLVGRDASREAILEVLGAEDVGLLHFAGHGVLGEDTWDARLELGGGSFLDLADLLTLERAPPLVVLAGCETGASAGGGAISFGLAQALVHAGSTAVVGTTRKVDDRVARAFSEALYAAAPLRHGMLLAFREAVDTVRTDHPDADWSTFRLYVP